MIRSRALALCAFAATAVVATAAQAAAAPVYTISIGQNEVPTSLRGGNADLVALHYADDDAAAFHSFMRSVSRHAFLLSVLDADTQRRFPGLVGEARVPNAAELAGVVAKVKRSMEEDRAAGLEPVLVLFYSGHGLRDASGVPGLALQDGALSQERLYTEVLGAIPAHVAHVIVDACHAEAVVRPRDVDAQVEALPADEMQRYLKATTLARLPHVGALLASTSSAQSFEWDAYHGGVFAHEVLSGLRGAADVNGDGRIEYSELAAFLAAANLQISDPRARPEIVVQPPRVDRRAAIVDLSGAPERQIQVAGRASGPWAAPFFVETESGVRLADVFAERDRPIALRLPTDELLYLVRPDGEVPLPPGAGPTIALESLPAAQPRARARGALDDAMRKGLFATAFGPAFYKGYVSQQPDFVAVELTPDAPASPVVPLVATDTGPSDGTRRTVGHVLVWSSAVAGAAALTFGGLAWHAKSQYNATNVEAAASSARTRFEHYSLYGIASGVGALALVGAGVAVLASTHAAPPPDNNAPALVFTGSGFALAGVF